jgi:ferric-dicitrate binding protein FerR (iron transport regulator)
MKEKEYIESLIARYLNGICLPEEQQKLKLWIEKSPENRTEYLTIKDIWDSSRSQADRTEDQLVLFYKNQLEKSKKARILWIRYSLAVAAILAVGLVISLLIPREKYSRHPNLQVFSVPLGSRSKVLLADGSIVNLNSGSELKYSSDFSDNNRVVSLTGEAFFQVKSDSVHPFIVSTNNFDVKVTGTKFNVCTYDENSYSSATLAEGKIELMVDGSDQNFVIKPGEKFMLERKTRKYTLESADIESEIAWKDGEFIFRNIPFPELVKRLERWYDVKLIYSDKRLQSYAYTGRFKNQETIWQVLDALRLTSPIDYRKKTFREFTLIYKPRN